jgi:large subunit ribosomal protein L10
MPRPEKVQAVADIKERFERARAVFLAEYAGLSVMDQQSLRRSLRAQGAEFKVVKMTLARRAADELDIEGLDELLLGPTGLAFAEEDAVTAAKALKDFAKAHEVFTIKGGLLGSDFLTPERISELAEIEPRDVLLARLAGAMQAPMANLAGLLEAMPRNFASMLQQLVDKKASDAPEAAEEPAAADEAPADEEAPEAEPEAAEDAAPEAAEEPAAADEAPADEEAPEAEPEAAEDAAPEAAEEPAAADEAPADEEAPEAEPEAAEDAAPAPEPKAPEVTDEAAPEAAGADSATTDTEETSKPAPADDEAAVAEEEETDGEDDD